MKKYHLLFALLFLFFIIKSHAQIGFEEGYFINESEEKVQCLIRNRDWKKNPTGFEYKLTKDSKIQTADIQTVKEFGISGFSRYIQATVDIDRSGTLPGKLSTAREPEFHKETVFLKVLVDGETPLYFFTDENVTRYFIKTHDSTIEQLIYKRFMKDYGVVTNYDFRYQLFNNFSNQGITMNDVQDVNYLKKDLERFFLKMNGSSGHNEFAFENKRKDDFNLTLRPGINFSRLDIRNAAYKRYATEFDRKTNFRFGIEAEYILPYNKNKWGIILEPTYQCYYETQPSFDFYTSRIVYESIEIPVGFRYYIFLNDHSKLYLNTSFMFDLDMHSDIRLFFESGKIGETVDIRSGINNASGIGFKFKNRYSMEMRYNTDRHVLATYKAWHTNYKTFSMIFGYTVF
jgi:hypothetical protein